MDCSRIAVLLLFFFLIEKDNIIVITFFLCNCIRDSINFGQGFTCRSDNSQITVSKVIYSVEQ